MKTSIPEEIRLCQRIIEYAIKHNNNAKAAIRYHTSRQQVKRWRDRYDGTIQSLLPKSRRPKSHPNQHTQEEIQLLLRKYKRFSFEGLAEVYVQCRKEGYRRSYGSMCKMIRKHKMGKEKKKRLRIKSKYEKKEVTFPGQRVQIDLKYIPESSIRFGLVEQKFYQITAIDEYTRKRVLKVVEEKSSYETSLFLEGLEEKFGFPIQVIQTDNGKEFTNDSKEKLSAFELELSKRKIVHERIRPYSPWQNGKVERSHRGDSAYYARQRFYSREELEKKVERYCHRYNNVAKKVLGFKSPNEVLEEYRREKKVELS